MNTKETFTSICKDEYILQCMYISNIMLDHMLNYCLKDLVFLKSTFINGLIEIVFQNLKKAK